jgi:hypothetical protein
MVRNVQKMPQESAKEIASARSGVGFSELLESTSVRLNRGLQEKSTTFFKNLLDKTRKGGYNSTR